MNENKFDNIPAEACLCTVAELELGDNGENAKSAPVQLVARSGGSIEHWFWGRVVHDMSGLHMHKSRLPIDFVHDPKEVIGYLNKFDTSSGDLVTSGALVPFKESDRATEIIHKMGEGVPYEASINFGGDGIKLEEVPEGMTTEVNGRQFDGPGVIIREWPLRGVAICPYGADANTESSALAGNTAKSYKATVFTSEPTKTEEITMSKEQVESVEVLAEEKAEAVELAEVVEKEELIAEADEGKELEEAVEVEEAEEKAEGEEPVEAEAVEAEEAEAEEEAPKDEKAEELAELSREEFCKIVDRFGAEIAAQVVKDGGDYEDAVELAYECATAELAEVKEKLAASGGTPVKVVEATEKTKVNLFKTGK